MGALGRARKQVIRASAAADPVNREQLEAFERQEQAETPRPRAERRRARRLLWRMLGLRQSGIMKADDTPGAR